MPLKNIKKKINFIGLGIEEIILTIILALNFFDFFKIISPDWDYVNKIISWTALGMLFYKVNLTKIFSGYENKKIDLILLMGYFSLIIKDLVSFSFIAIEEASPFLTPLYLSLINNYVKINIFSLYLGIAFISISSLIFCLKLNVKKPSILFHLHETGKEVKTNGMDGIKKTKMFFSFFIVSILFFVGVFNLVMEWLAIAIDDPLLMIGIATYFFFVIKHKNKFSINSFLNKFGSFGEKFYKNLLEHLKYKRGLILIVGGILTLHMFTDLFNFIWAYLFNLFEPFYHSLINTDKISILELYFQNTTNTTFIYTLIISIIYFFNIIAIIFLLGYSTYLWYTIYKNKKIHKNKYVSLSLIISIIISTIYPLFHLKLIGDNGLYGLKLIPSLIFVETIYFPLIILICSIMLFFVIKIIKNKIFLNYFDKFLIITSQIYFIYYISLFFYSLCTYYFITIMHLIEMQNFILFIFFTLLFTSTILFYFVGLFGFEKNIIEYLKKYDELEENK
jgi:hypothetical protein